MTVSLDGRKFVHRSRTLPLWQRALILLSGTVVATVLVIALYEGRPVLIPIALAVLLTFLLNPLIEWLRHRGLNRTVAVFLAVTLAAVVVMGVGLLITRQVAGLMAELPQNKANITAKIKTVRHIFARGTVHELGQMVQEVRSEVQNLANAEGDAKKPVVPTDSPIQPSEPDDSPVIVQAEPTPWLSLTGYLNSAFEVLATLAFALILLVFFLLGREDLRDRVVLIAGGAHLALTSKALEDVTDRVSRYLVMLAMLNGGFGLLLTGGLLIIGVPYAFLWGFLAGALRFIPYIGPWIGAAFPIVMSLAVFDGWWQPLAVMGFVLTLELISNNIIEPMVFGRSIGVSPTALLISAAFWLYVWGPVGLILSAPIAVCLLVAGKNIPQLRFLELLLGDAPALRAEVSLYQRLMLGDQLATNLRVTEFVKNQPAENVYDELLIPAMIYAKRDAQRDHLSDDDHTVVLSGVRATLRHLEELHRENLIDSYSSASALSEVPRIRIRVLGCPADEEDDQIVLEMLRQMLPENRWDFDLAGIATLTSELVTRIVEDPPDVVFISSLPPGGLAQARYLCKRLRDADPEMQIIVGRWGLQRNVKSQTERLEHAGASGVTMGLLEARKLLESRVAIFAAHNSRNNGA